MNHLSAQARQVQEFAQRLEPVELARALAAMSATEQAEAKAAWAKDHFDIGGPLGELKRMVLQAWLGNTPGWFASEINSWSMGEIVADDELRDLLVARLVERGREWVQELLSEVTADPDHAAWVAWMIRISSPSDRRKSGHEARGTTSPFTAMAVRSTWIRSASKRAASPIPSRHVIG